VARSRGALPIPPAALLLLSLFLSLTFSPTWAGRSFLGPPLLGEARPADEELLLLSSPAPAGASAAAAETLEAAVMVEAPPPLWTESGEEAVSVRTLSAPPAAPAAPAASDASAATGAMESSEEFLAPVAAAPAPPAAPLTGVEGPLPAVAIA
jgi:hypothetical protein